MRVSQTQCLTVANEALEKVDFNEYLYMNFTIYHSKHFFFGFMRIIHLPLYDKGMLFAHYFAFMIPTTTG